MNGTILKRIVMLVCGLMVSVPAFAQIEITGSYVPLMYEDYIERGPGSDLGDFTGNIAAGNVRKGDRHARDAAAHPKIEMIERASLDAHEDFIGADDWVGHVFVFKYVRPAVLLENDGLQRTLSSLS